MNPYSKPFLRKRFLAKQQSQMAEDAKLADPADAYRELLEEIDTNDEERADRAA